MEYLIVNADDFGLCSSVNQAIIEGHNAGNISSTTLMVNMPGTDDAIRLAKEYSELGIGLHFCITEGKSLTGKSSLTDINGYFYNWHKLNSLLLKGTVLKADIYNELNAQFEYINNSGIKVTHVDSHQHIHMNNTVFSVFVAFFDKHPLPIRLVDPPFNLGLIFRRPKKAFKQYLLKLLSAKHRHKTKNKTNDHLITIHDLLGLDEINIESYKLLFCKKNLGKTVELMVHPYIYGEDLKSLYLNVWKQKAAFLALCFSEHKTLKTRGAIESITGLKPVRYDQV